MQTKKMKLTKRPPVLTSDISDTIAKLTRLCNYTACFLQTFSNSTVVDEVLLYIVLLVFLANYLHGDLQCFAVFMYLKINLKPGLPYTLQWGIFKIESQF